MKNNLLTLLILIVVFQIGNAQPQQEQSYIKQHYIKQEFMIPMRDGVKLFTAVYTPKDTTRSYPIMLNRTCYSVGPYGPNAYPGNLGPSPEFTKEGFIFVYQDVRGKYHSEGNWTEIAPFIEGKTGSQHDEASDTYDVVDWLIKHIAHNNQKVGVWGISYPGFFATNAALSGHPAIKAVSPQAPVTNWFLGDDTHHNGAFFLMDEVSFDYGFANSTNGPNKDKLKPLNLDTKDSYKFYLKLGTVSAVNEQYYHHQIPFWDTILMHPNYDKWWIQRDIRRFMYNVKPATLLVGGWYDAEDLWGTLQTYGRIEKQNSGNENALVMGPWNHGGWAGPAMDHLGDISFGSNTSRWFQKNIEFPFFMHYLKDAEKPALPEATLYDVGLNRWEKFDQWPAREIQPVHLYFQDAGKIGIKTPTAEQSFSEYESDPANPVPYQGGVRSSRGVTYMIDDQRFATDRKDVVSFTIPVLDSNLTIAGRLKASLYISTTGTDADFIVKLIDVYPDSLTSVDKDPHLKGYQSLVRAEIMRGKFRNSFARPEPFLPGQPALVEYNIPDILYTFKKGHRLMIQVQSSWFPLVDRNPQVFTDIYQAKPEDFKKATIRLYHDKAHPSSLEAGILPSASQQCYAQGQDL